METELRTLEVDVHVDVVEKISEHVQKISKKAVRYGLPAITMTVGKEFLYDTKRPLPGLRDGKVETLKLPAVTVVVTYPIVKLSGGWKPVATIEAYDCGYNVINGGIRDIEEYKKLDLRRCDHCNVRRYRRMVVVVENDHGERKVVGRTCVKEYLGIDVTHFQFLCDIAYNLGKAMGEDEIGEWVEKGSHREFGKDIETVTKYLVAVMMEDNWTYRSAKYWDEFCNWSPTTHKVSILLYANSRDDIALKNKRKAIESDETIAKYTSEWIAEYRAKYPIESLETIDDSFEYSFALLINSGFIDHKRTRLFLGTFGYKIHRSMAEKRESEAKKNPKLSEYVGKVGEKIKKVELEITKTKLIEGQWGDSLMVSGYFKGTNNQFVTFMSGNTDWLYTKDNELIGEMVVDATIKNQQDRGYGKQTVLTRVRATK